jgi:membrane-associated protein
MNLEQFFSQAFSLVSEFSPRVGMLIFLVSFIGEGLLISIPLVLDIAFVTAGIKLSQGQMPIWSLLMLLVMSQLGRHLGAILLFTLSRQSSSFLGKFIARRLPKKTSEEGEGKPLKLLQRIDTISPFGVALGRLLWLRVPITLILGARRKLKTLVIGIAISSVIYDFVYIGLGAVVGRKADLDSPYMLLYLAGGLLFLYGITFAVRMLARRLKRGRRKPAEATVGVDGTQGQL